MAIYLDPAAQHSLETAELRFTDALVEQVDGDDEWLWGALREWATLCLRLDDQIARLESEKSALLAANDELRAALRSR